MAYGNVLDLYNRMPGYGGQQRRMPRGRYLGWTGRMPQQGGDYLETMPIMGGGNFGGYNPGGGGMPQINKTQMTPTGYAGEPYDQYMERLNQQKSGINQYGDPIETMYLGGTPLFNEGTGQTISVEEYQAGKQNRQPQAGIPPNRIPRDGFIGNDIRPNPDWNPGGTIQPTFQPTLGGPRPGAQEPYQFGKNFGKKFMKTGKLGKKGRRQAEAAGYDSQQFEKRLGESGAPNQGYVKSFAQDYGNAYPGN